MTVTLDLAPDKEATFRAQAQAAGLTVEQWLLRLADQEAGSNAAKCAEDRPVSELMREIWGDMPADVRAKLPRDGARQIDHYVHGLPKRD
jgi:hypothetical protein